MKKIIALLVLVWYGMVGAHDEQDDKVHVVVTAQSYQKIPVFIGCIGLQDQELLQLAQTIASDFELTGQCTVTVQQIPDFHTKTYVQGLFDQGYYSAIFLTHDTLSIHWRLYDTQQALMIAGKKCQKQKNVLRGSAHKVADQIWPAFMGNASSFGSKIAYCKQLWVKERGKEKVYKHIYIADIDGSYARPLVEIPTVCIAPRWSNQPDDVILFYSENTLSNVRLVMANMYGKRKTICSFDGLNMLPAFADDYKNIVFCLSKDGSSQLYHSCLNADNKRVFNRLTHNNAENFSPCYINEHTIAFASDYATKYPGIYLLDIKTLVISPIATSGYCACPAYCKANNKLLYSKMMGQAMQIFTYDLVTQQHQQITTGADSKEEGCWSPCGNFIAYAARLHGKSRIARYNILTGKTEYITSEKDHCTYPAWSPVHTQFIV